MSFRIDEEFKNLIPPLSPDEYLMLEENCKNYRIRDALFFFAISYLLWPSIRTGPSLPGNTPTTNASLIR